LDGCVRKVQTAEWLSLGKRAAAGKFIALKCDLESLVEHFKGTSQAIGNSQKIENRRFDVVHRRTQGANFTAPAKSEDPTTSLSVRRLGKHLDKLPSIVSGSKRGRDWASAQLATNPSV
jgi:hypothetical protein